MVSGRFQLKKLQQKETTDFFILWKLTTYKNELKSTIFTFLFTQKNSKIELCTI